ncbi:hypothetical protein Hamer_G014591 [Homarus americanus]|uniref:Uncharacterized protein n=1 Tax=Homarus americanus TaxID=6706 RepID=A0A8J5T7U3_HOMAM|nr:hypothetical protein Hamer_G014591 [Homarus americanus]
MDVSWIRHRDTHILTVVPSPTQRPQVLGATQEGTNEWTTDTPKVDDSGLMSVRCLPSLYEPTSSVWRS